MWRNNRKAVVNSLKPVPSDKFTPTIVFEFKELINRLQEKIKKEKVINPWRDIQLSIINTQISLLANERMNDIKDPQFEALSKIVTENAYYVGNFSDFSLFFPYLSGVDILSGKRKTMQLHQESRKKVFEKLIKSTLESQAPSLIKDLYSMKDKDQSINEDDIFVLFGDLLVAGTETPVNSIHWALAVLSVYPEIQDKVIKEIDDWKAQNPTKEYPDFQEDRESFLYSVCVQKEVLRFRPPVPFTVPRSCSKDIVVNG
ncbi:cytochrome P450 [Sporodiniella umbellata]|nr:cytochrome P450 [Sporodiniella umbellata]